MKEESQIFVRAETVTLWEKIENTLVVQGTNLRITGPPGTGKSTEAWAWALWKAGSAKQTITWLHFTKTRKVKVVIGPERVVRCDVSNSTDLSLLIAQSCSDYLIVDGVTKENSTSFLQSCSSWFEKTKKPFLVVTSVSVPLSVEVEGSAKLETHVVPSWVVDQYLEACRSRTFYESVYANLQRPNGIDNGVLVWEEEKVAEIVQEKDFYAGGSARWMFDFSYADFKKDFNTHFAKVLNYKAILSQAEGPEHPNAVNHLRGLSFNDEQFSPFFISQYTANRVKDQCRRDDDFDFLRFLSDAYEKANGTENPAFGGWVYEFDIDDQLRTAMETEGGQFAARGDPKTYRVDHYMSYPNEPRNPTLIREVTTYFRDPKNEHKSFWAKPDLWKNPAFDFLCFQLLSPTLSPSFCSSSSSSSSSFPPRQLKVIAFNGTQGKAHDVKLSFLSVLAKNFAEQPDWAIAKIEFLFVVPERDGFEVGTITGDLRSWDWPSSAQKNEIVASNYIDTFQLPRRSRKRKREVEGAFLFFSFFLSCISSPACFRSCSSSYFCFQECELSTDIPLDSPHFCVPLCVCFCLVPKNHKTKTQTTLY